MLSKGHGPGHGRRPRPQRPSLPAYHGRAARKSRRYGRLAPTIADWAAANLTGIQARLRRMLTRISAFDAILANGARKAPLRTRLVSVTTAATGDSPTESAGKTISRMALHATGLEPRKSSCTVALTEEALALAAPQTRKFRAQRTSARPEPRDQHDVPSRAGRSRRTRLAIADAAPTSRPMCTPCCRPSISARPPSCS